MRHLNCSKLFRKGSWPSVENNFVPKLPVIKVQELVRVLNKLGFFKFHQVGSHAQFKHPDGRKTTVPIHYGRDVKKKMLRGIIDDLDISVDEFVILLKK